MRRLLACLLLAIFVPGCVASHGSTQGTDAPFVVSNTQTGSGGGGLTPGTEAGSTSLAPGSDTATVTVTSTDTETATTTVSQPTTPDRTTSQTTTVPPTQTTSTTSDTTTATQTTTETTTETTTTTTQPTTTDPTTTTDTTTSTQSSSTTSTSTTQQDTAPAADLAASSQSGTAPLQVTFSLDGMGVDGDPLTWDFYAEGLSGPVVSGVGADLPATVSHTYAEGTYTAVLVVHDGTLDGQATLDITATAA